MALKKRGKRGGGGNGRPPTGGLDHGRKGVRVVGDWQGGGGLSEGRTAQRFGRSKAEHNQKKENEKRESMRWAVVGVRLMKKAIKTV